MISANELRIGNWVNVLHPFTNKWNPEKIKAKTILNLEENGKNSLMINNFSPIPITEEWLLKFGFGKDNEFDNHFIDNGSLKNEIIRIATDSNYFTIDLFGGQVFEIPNIKHIHQLQNLYFSLTGKELELK